MALQRYYFHKHYTDANHSIISALSQRQHKLKTKTATLNCP